MSFFKKKYQLEPIRTHNNNNNTLFDTLSLDIGRLRNLRSLRSLGREKKSLNSLISLISLLITNY